MASSFEEFGLFPQLTQAVEQMGFSEPSPIQQAAIPVLLNGQNVIGQAQTGTGKTAAFVLPMLQTILQQKADEQQDARPNGKTAIQALVLAPTRELAIQVADAAGRMAQKTSVRIMPVYGGQAYYIQTRKIERGVDVVVGTPGRLLDLINQKVLDLSQVRYLVLDEADEMLEMGFIEDVETILSKIEGERQVALFSATLPEAIRKLADRYVSDPQRIAINPSHLTVAETEQRYFRVREENKLEALTRLLEVEEVKSALIFARTKARAQELADALILKGFPAESLHGDLSQARRETVLNRFRQKAITLLVATDVAARGLDIENVTHVFNYDVPGDAEDYVHRIGRTGRAGRKGVAITFLHPRERARLREIEAYTHQPVIEGKLPSGEEMQARRDERFVAHLYEQLMGGVRERERAMVSRLMESDLDLVDIAAAAIRMARAGESQLPVTEINEPAYEPRGARPFGRKARGAEGSPADHPRSRPYRERGSRPQEAGMVRLRMNLGEQHGLRPGDVVGAIASEVGVPGRAIGEIHILRDHTFVDVSEKHVRRILQASSGQYQLRGRPVLLTLAS